MSFSTLLFSTTGRCFYRDFEAMMEERGVKGDHSTLNRWVYQLFIFLGFCG
jgi:transposase-like protein